MNYYNEIRELRNRKLYNGKPPLKFGSDVFVVSKNGFVNNYIYIDGKSIYSPELQQVHSSKKARIDVSLGREVTINDILLLIKMKYGAQLAIDCYGGLIEYINGDRYHNHGEPSQQSLYIGEWDGIDLERSVKRQEEAVLLQIYNLIR